MNREQRKRKKRNDRLKAKAVGILGAATGAAIAHTATNAARASKAGREFSRLPGAQRAEYIAPIVIGAGVGAYVANHKRKQAMENHLKRQSDIRRLTKQAGVNPYAAGALLGGISGAGAGVATGDGSDTLKRAIIGGGLGAALGAGGGHLVAKSGRSASSASSAASKAKGAAKPATNVKGQAFKTQIDEAGHLYAVPVSGKGAPVKIDDPHLLSTLKKGGAGGGELQVTFTGTGSGSLSDAIYGAYPKLKKTASFNPHQWVLDSLIR